MKNEPLVIVGVATCNNQDTIEKTLEMILNQTRPPDRVIFCDKSSDKTPRKVRGYKDYVDRSSIEIIDQSGDGVADAYNCILDHISDKYDIFVTIQTELQVDDEWLSGHIAAHADHPEADMVMGDHKTNNPTNAMVEPDDRPYYVGRNFSAKQGTLERINGWDSNFLRGEDWDMRIRLAGAGINVYAGTDLGHYWQDGVNDRYVTYSKAKRKPTSVSFLSKFGLWYITYHPSHIISDTLSMLALIALGGTFVSAPFFPSLAFIFISILTFVIVSYWVGHVMLRGRVDQKLFTGPVRKQFLNGFAVVHAFNRVLRNDIQWNMNGFDPDNIPRYKF